MLNRTLLVYLLVQTSLIPSLASASSDPRAKIMRCAKNNPQRCEILVSGPLEHIDARAGFELFRGTKLIYSADHTKAVTTKSNARHLQFISEGRWHIPPALRRKILNEGRILDYVRKGSQDVKEAYRDNYLLTATSGDKEFAKTDETHPTINKSDELNGKTEYLSEPVPSVMERLERLERWASRSDGNDFPRINITTRFGTPNSPSAMIGASVDTFFLSRVLPITLAGGEYDSLRFVEGRYGRLNYHTQSLGTGLLIGKSWTRFKIGINYTEIKARFRAPESSEKGGYVNAKRTYSGLTPHIGLYGISSGEVSYAFDYGGFMPLDSRYSSDPGAPYRSQNQPLQMRNRKQFFSFGLGLAF